MDEVIKIKNLCKSYGNIKAVNNINFKVKKGEFFSFLGINGAGKSTTISMICGSLKKDSGEILVCGKNIESNSEYIKRRIGVVFQDSVLDKDLTVKENLKNRASLYNIFGNEFKEKYSELKEIFNLKDIENRPIKNLSGGQKRRVDIARALIHSPEILILDEPTTGLDPSTRKSIWEIINKLRKEKGLTVFLTTHYMEEADDSDYIVILDKGRIIAEGIPLDLKNKYAKDTVAIYNVSLDDIKKLNLPYKKIRNGYKIEVENTSKVTELIIKNKELFNDYEVIKGRMDDVFLNATGYELEGV